MSQHAEGTAYLQIRPHHLHAGECRVVKATQRRPDVVEPGCVVVKIRLRIPRAVFEPLEPETIVTVSESTVQQPIDVEAANPE